MDDVLSTHFVSWKHIVSRYGVDEWSTAAGSVVSCASWLTHVSSFGGAEESYHYNEYDEGRWLL
jgi:hypothetical protein